MRFESVLLALAVSLQVVLVALVASVAWRLRIASAPPATLARGEAPARVSRLERRVDRLHAKLQSLRRVRRLARQRGTARVQPPAGKPRPLGSVAPAAPEVPAASLALDPARLPPPPPVPSIEILLASNRFREEVWLLLAGPLPEAIERVGGYLRSQGVVAPEIEPYPPSAAQAHNHWSFLVVRSRPVNADSVRVLVPRPYTRYDPALHDHLFRISRPTTTLDTFIRECRACAVLGGAGEIEGLIAASLVKKKGEIVV